jgi:hypothetical protein
MCRWSARHGRIRHTAAADLATVNTLLKIRMALQMQCHFFIAGSIVASDLLQLDSNSSALPPTTGTDPIRFMFLQIKMAPIAVPFLIR